MPEPNRHNRNPEHDWARQLERGRLSSSLAGGTSLPGPGAAAGTSAAGPKAANPAGGPAVGPTAGKSSGPLPELPTKRDPETGQQKAPSSIETAKTLAKAGSVTGLGKIAAEEAEKLGKYFQSGSILASAQAGWYLVNKYLPWLLLFLAFSLLFEEPFITVPTMILTLWVWAAGSHWLKIKWLRNFNNLEWLALIVLTSMYLAALTLIMILITLVIDLVSNISSQLDIVWSTLGR